MIVPVQLLLNETSLPLAINLFSMNQILKWPEESPQPPGKIHIISFGCLRSWTHFKLVQLLLKETSVSRYNFLLHEPNSLKLVGNDQKSLSSHRPKSIQFVVLAARHFIESLEFLFVFQVRLNQIRWSLSQLFYSNLIVASIATLHLVAVT